MIKSNLTIVCLIPVLLSIVGCCFTSDCDCGGPPYDSNIRIDFRGISDSSFFDEEAIEILDSNGTNVKLVKYWDEANSIMAFHTGAIGHGRYAFRINSGGESGKMDLNIPENEYSDTWCKPEGQFNSGAYQLDTVRIKSIEFHCLTDYIMPGCE